MFKHIFLAACVLMLANSTFVLGLEPHSRRLAALLAREPRHEKLQQWLEAEGYESIPITRLKNSDHLVVAVSTNGNQLRLGLDTGAPQTSLDPARVESMKLEWKYADDLPGGEKLSNLKSQLAVEFEGLEVGKFKTGRTRVYSVNLEHVNAFLKDLKEDSLDGLLAGDVLSRYAAVVDYPSMRLYLKRAKPSTASGAAELRDRESRHAKLRRLLEAERYARIQITPFNNSNQLLVHRQRLILG